MSLQTKEYEITVAVKLTVDTSVFDNSITGGLGDYFYEFDSPEDYLKFIAKSVALGNIATVDDPIAEDLMPLRKLGISGIVINENVEIK